MRIERPGGKAIIVVQHQDVQCFVAQHRIVQRSNVEGVFAIIIDNIYSCVLAVCCKSYVPQFTSLITHKLGGSLLFFLCVGRCYSISCCYFQYCVL